MTFWKAAAVLVILLIFDLLTGCVTRQYAQFRYDEGRLDQARETLDRQVKYEAERENDCRDTRAKHFEEAIDRLAQQIIITDEIKQKEGIK